MKKMTQFIVATSFSLTALAPVFAIQNDLDSIDDYTIIAYKDCKLVFQQPMSVAQIDAYHDLQTQADKMDDLELGIDGIEAEVEHFTQEIELLTDLAIQDSDGTLTINKNLLAEQQDIVAQLEHFMENNEHRFDALTDHADVLADYADTFGDLIEDDLSAVDYDNVRIITPDNRNENFRCDNLSISM